MTVMNRTYNRSGRLITIENLNLEFNGNKILRDINLHIDDVHRPNMQQGQVVAVLGPSGIGKTQLFRCISGLMKPTSGAILLNEERHPVYAGEVGFVFQNYPLMDHRTVLDNLMLAANNGGKKKEEVMELLTMFHLDDKAKHYPDQLSGGQRQRISIMQQLLCSDHFVLMDEPFSGLDIISKQKMMNLILKISQVHEHNTLILTTHDIDAAVSIADTIWVVGYEKDAKGSLIPGATVLKEIDLIERGLTWDPDVRHHPNFRRTCEELYDMFEKLV
jgi:ABC-type nitrate/sulfonate/bicarbonate transport system ATPase subunit